MEQKQLKLESFHRVISEVTEEKKIKLLQFLERDFMLKKGKKNLSVEQGNVNIYINETWYNITFESKNKKIAVQALSDDILKRIFYYGIMKKDMICYLVMQKNISSQSSTK